MAEINVVPYIDVMLVLLIIFMVTAPLLQQGVEIDLPQAAAEPLESNQLDAIVINIKRNGEYLVQVGSGKTTGVEKTDLTDFVVTLKNKHPSSPVLIRGDKAVAYGKIVDALVLLQSASIEKVSLMTEMPEVLGEKQPRS
ncbi:MAG: protein TolR [Gammaproteobacteria bacterium]|nr:protein TolR [Gammaproteobacteria bacterium]